MRMIHALALAGLTALGASAAAQTHQGPQGHHTGAQTHQGPHGHHAAGHPHGGTRGHHPGPAVHPGGHPHGGGAHPASPYAGLEARAVKALSSQQIADLRAGRGMGLALAAELNGYPGPLHVLELADPLALTPVQRDQTQALFDAMKAEAVPLGERIIAEETALERLFAEGRITPAALDEATGRIGRLQGELRGVHLRVHLGMRDLLAPGQIARYDERRGYRR